MMTNMRTKRTSEFKAKVALAAIRGDQTLSELASSYKVHANQITNWKHQAQEHLAAVFDSKRAKSLNRHSAPLHQIIELIFSNTNISH